MAAPQFDHSRSNESLYNNLQTSGDRTHLQKYIYDFVAWFKTCPEGSSTEQWAKWGASFTTFVSILNDDRAWEIARPVIPEFRETKDYVSPNEQMNLLLEVVRGRLADPPVDKPLTFEERLVWEREKAQIDYLAYGRQSQGR